MLLILLWVGAGAQGLVQTGGYLVLNNGAHLVMDGSGNYYDSLDGRIHIATNGTIHLPGVWTNSSNNSVFTTNDGLVRLTGGIQDIRGSHVTGFPSVQCAGSGIKRLQTNALVGGAYQGTGTITLNSNLDLNGYKLIINSSAGSAIGGTGGIISETSGTLGWVQWNVDNQTGLYRIPFIAQTGAPVPVTLQVSNAGNPVTDSASIALATYPTNPISNPNNLPSPPGTGSIDAYGKDQSAHAVDRFWIAQTADYQTQPTGNMTVRYLDAEWASIGGSSNTIEETSLRAIYFNPISGLWNFPGSGVPFYTQNEVRTSTTPFNGSWTLVDSLYCPDVRYTWKGNCVESPIDFLNGSSIKRGLIDSIRWTFEMNSTSNLDAPTHTFNAADTYPVALIAFADNGCTDTLIQDVPIDDRAVADFDVESPNFIRLPVQFNNRSQLADFWMWDFGDGTVSSEEHPVHMYAESGFYDVLLISDHSKHCPDTLSIELEVKPITEFYLPTAFSPGVDDDINATLGLQTILPLSEYHLLIYNRWGEQIFESESIDVRWDGTYQEGYVPGGTYLYRLSFRDTSGRAYYRNGTITVLR
ncbi:MAG: gliding motility-associated C-terminal domain-containing protein [Flavobacteriales bacterium]|nr:gliding motility-associated C-terminal domain-containing protein [Flavobacteriales bacterium]